MSFDFFFLQKLNEKSRNSLGRGGTRSTAQLYDKLKLELELQNPKNYEEIVCVFIKNKLKRNTLTNCAQWKKKQQPDTSMLETQNQTNNRNDKVQFKIGLFCNEQQPKRICQS